MSKNKAQKEAKKAAWAAKKEKEESKVIGWIFAVLIALGIAFWIYSVLM